MFKNLKTLYPCGSRTRDLLGLEAVAMTLCHAARALRQTLCFSQSGVDVMIKSFGDVCQKMAFF
jgi:hypothetical protein